MQKNYLLFIVMAFLPLVMNAQNTVSGKVTNSSNGLPLSGAHIIVLDTKFSAISDANGYYLITGLSFDTYTLKASYIGFESRTI